MKSTGTGTGLCGWCSRVFGSFCAVFTVCCLALLMPAPGCSDMALFPFTDEAPNDNGNDNDSADGDEEVTATIINFLSNFPLSALEDPISVVYTVTGTPAAVSGLYVRVADSSPGAGELGDRVAFITGLTAGASQAFSFDPADVAVGNYRVGVRVTAGGEIIDALSLGVIQVQGSPNPVFHQPVDAVTELTAGEAVQVSFDAGDPEGDVRWRLFFTTASDSLSASPDQIGTELAVGSGNFGEYLFSTTGRDPGDYMLGLSATDTGLSISATGSAGDLGRIITVGDEQSEGPIIRVLAEHVPVPPTISVLSPGAGGVELFMDEAYKIQLTAFVGELGATGVIELFYDNNASISDGFSASIAGGLPAGTSSFSLPTDLPEGTHFIGASIDDGVSPVEYDYSDGTVTIVRTAVLTVSGPDTNLPLTPSTAGSAPNTIPVTWSSNVPESAGALDVYAKSVDSDGAAFGAEIQILAAGSTQATTAQFSSETSGRYEIFVRIIYDEQFGLPPLIHSAPQPVRVSSLPPILWLGSIAEESPPFDGAIFEGVNFEDNAGTVLSPAGDLNGDNLAEFVIVSRYGKPFFSNPTGVGHGEAYLIYGATGANRLTGVYNLNSVGTSVLTGVLLTGIPTVGNNEDTDGLSDVELIPDADGDDMDELAFGFPRTDSAGANVGSLESAGQFLNGGVVILSSKNSILHNPTLGTPVIPLVEVGQRFSDMSVTWGTVEVLDDLLTFELGDPDADPPTANACVAGSDEVDDTVFGPSNGFIPLLAPTGFEQVGFIPIPPGTPPAPGECVTQYNVPDCVDPAAGNSNPFSDAVPGSGFYELSPALEPFGARIIGPDADGAFGTSITHSNALGDDSPGDLIISAPNRTATVGEFPANAIDFDILDSGVALLARNRNLWEPDDFFLNGQDPPTPHQYVMRVTSHCGDNRAPPLGQLSIAGDTNDNIQNIIGIDDFNGDGRNDFAVGAPTAGAGTGRVYIAYRRETSIEGGFVLHKLEHDTSEPERLDGLLIVSSTLAGLGSSLATGFDFNGDGAADLAMGSPRASGGVGEVIIMFGQTGVASGVNGISVANLLQAERTADGRPVAARITGIEADGQFGFNVANAGDIDGDGLDDLLIAAPNATPRFDPDPTDSVDELTAAGVDVDFDGDKDDVSGPEGVPDGLVDTNDDLLNAGVVYVIFGRNRLDQILNTEITISIEELGSNQLAGFAVAGRRAGDRLGGGDAGDLLQGGIGEKADRGRSHGLSSAGDVDGDGRADILIGSILADPRLDPNTGLGVKNGGEAYLIYGSSLP